MGEKFLSLPELFIDKMIKQWMKYSIKFVAHLSKCLKWNKENQQTEPMHVAKEMGRNILSSVDFQRYAM